LQDDASDQTHRGYNQRNIQKLFHTMCLLEISGQIIPVWEGNRQTKMMNDEW
jgi:hypothetical protein